MIGIGYPYPVNLNLTFHYRERITVTHFYQQILTTDFLSDVMSSFAKIKCSQLKCALIQKDKIPLRRSLQSARRQCYSVFFERDGVVEEFESLTDVVVLDVSKLMNLNRISITSGNWIIAHPE